MVQQQAFAEKSMNVLCTDTEASRKRDPRTHEATSSNAQRPSIRKKRRRNGFLSDEKRYWPLNEPTRKALLQNQEKNI
jgi:hypothetical protein